MGDKPEGKVSHWKTGGWPSIELGLLFVLELFLASALPHPLRGIRLKGQLIGGPEPCYSRHQKGRLVSLPGSSKLGCLEGPHGGAAPARLSDDF